MERNLPAFVVYHVLRKCKILIVAQIKFFCLRTTANIDLLMVQGTAAIRAIKKAGANTRTDLPALLSATAPVHPWSPTKTML
jgi:hypothetical protein